MHDLIDSILIGGFGSFLPFWQWDGPSDQMWCAIGLIGLVFIFKRSQIWD